MNIIKLFADNVVCADSIVFQDASPWTTFGHVAGNAAMMEAFEGEMKIHIVDISSTYCTQWPTLLEALATRENGTPHLRLSTIVISPEETALDLMKQIMTRLGRFARLMGVPFEFTVTHQPQLEKLQLQLRPDEALAITCNQTLHHVSELVPAGEQYSPRDLLLCTFRTANPKVPSTPIVFFNLYSCYRHLKNRLHRKNERFCF